MKAVSETVGQMIAERPARARVFEEAGIDCSALGQQTLAEACRKKGLDPDSILDRLIEVDRKEDSAVRNWSEIPLGDLCDCIETTLHSQLKRELPRVGVLLYRVAEGHGERHPELTRVLELYSLFSGDLKMQMTKEEETLFPLIRELERTCSADQNLFRMLEQMEIEHECTNQALREMRSLTHDFNPPADASDAYRAVLDALRNLENHLQEHFGIENNVLFPRVFQMQFAATV
jgi:regulator of cell morphogenesis and NO signaling